MNRLDFVYIMGLGSIVFIGLLTCVFAFRYGQHVGRSHQCQTEVSKARVLAPEQAIVLYEMCLSGRE
jgi:hypothetical protein